MRPPAIAALALLSLLQPALAGAQRTFPPATLENLKVLPKDTTAREVIARMRELTIGLGVRCQFCHVGREGLPLDQFDFVADTLPRKEVARGMMRLVATINERLQKESPAPGTAATVTCYTCHRGAERPVHAPGAQED